MAGSKVTTARRTQEERSAASAKLLVAATIELIAEKGFERTTAAEIGERAGYSREMVRHRYGSKEQLLRWLLKHEHKDLLLRPPSGHRRGLEEALAQIGLMAEVAAADPERFRAFLVLCFSYGLHRDEFDFTSALDRLHRRLRDAWRPARDA